MPFVGFQGPFLQPLQLLQLSGSLQEGLQRAPRGSLIGHRSLSKTTVVPSGRLRPKSTQLFKSLFEESGSGSSVQESVQHDPQESSVMK